MPDLDSKLASTVAHMYCDMTIDMVSILVLILPRAPPPPTEKKGYDQT